jgi:hypothetical protein
VNASATVALETLGGGAAAGGAATGPRFTPADLSRFESALARANAGPPSAVSAAASPGMQALIKPFDHLDTQAQTLSAKAAEFVAAGHSMTPGEMIMMTVRCQEFMFHCQLTSNAANRTSDGLQQLFRQQA